MIDEAERLNIEVLIADDDPISRDILQVFLETLGCRVSIANDGIQAIRAAKACADWIDAIVLDAYMPGPEPRELYDQVHAASPGIPILICSALSRGDARLDFVAERGVPLLSKPFRRVELREAIENVLRERPAAA